MKVQFEGSLPVCIVAGDAPGVDVPEALALLQLERLRLVDGEVVDAATLREFHVDERGRRHADAGPGRQMLRCGWDDRVIPDASGWRVEAPSARLAGARAQALEKALAMIAGLSAPILATYTPAERESWATQAAEARAVQAGADAANAPMLTLLAKSRGIALADIAVLVMAQAERFISIAATEQALRRQSEAAITAAKTAEDIADALTTTASAVAAARAMATSAARPA